jgi:hypothetical protein
MDKKNLTISRTCVLCKKTIKKFAKWNDNKSRSVHRSCWLNFRDFGDRHFDFLFCPDRKFNNNGKNIIIKPAVVSTDEGKEEETQFNIELEDHNVPSKS